MFEPITGGIIIAKVAVAKATTGFRRLCNHGSGSCCTICEFVATPAGSGNPLCERAWVAQTHALDMNTTAIKEKSMHKILHLLLATALFAVLVGLSMQGTVHAASLKQAQSQVTCSLGGGCDGQDPVATGCDYDAYTVTSQDLNGLGLVELRYSPTCGANWARVTSYSGTAYPYLHGDVISNTSGEMICYPTDCVLGINGTLLWTSMVYSPDPHSAYADGCVNMACGKTALG